MNAARLAILADLAAETAAIAAGEKIVIIDADAVAAFERELAEPFEACLTFQHYGKRNDETGIWAIELAKACRAKRAAILAAHFARVAARAAILDQVAAETSAILAGSLVVSSEPHEIAAIQRELAEPFEASIAFYHYGRRTDETSVWQIALCKACRAKRAAILSAHFARFALAA